eukprot:CAMPEP_0202825620 /NCGR_PEP_ID=MMETSP1389-20130828/13138_1 /ASSEMBLY_ACC=CAM_ASM_000865 /TAXON_ID=302021 /ORGANISM="Rhodomonas sp., Strain CCMP768" /LENGTH=248 /DNA_ID=CAMNT_0049498861 /DNA_START=53 /DNA_END=799 /DNA_ORIENTATION=+
MATSSLRYPMLSRQGSDPSSTRSSPDMTTGRNFSSSNENPPVAYSKRRRNSPLAPLIVEGSKRSSSPAQAPSPLARRVSQMNTMRRESPSPMSHSPCPSPSGSGAHKVSHSRNSPSPIFTRGRTPSVAHDSDGSSSTNIGFPPPVKSRVRRKTSMPSNTELLQLLKARRMPQVGHPTLSRTTSSLEPTEQHPAQSDRAPPMFKIMPRESRQVVLMGLEQCDGVDMAVLVLSIVSFLVTSAFILLQHRQ